MEPVSPELVLVDRTLADRVHSRLSMPEDTLARIDALVQASRRRALARRSMATLHQTEPRVVERPRRVEVGRTCATRWRGRPVTFAGGVAAGTLIAVMLLGLRADVTGDPGGANTPVLEGIDAPIIPVSTPAVPAPVPAVPKTQIGRTSSRPSPRLPADPRPRLQRFAWAPVVGASSYEVELFRGSSKVFEADTRRPVLTIPARWIFEQKRQTLRPGTYRWYVWPVSSGTRATTAVVQAMLTVPPR